MAISDEMTECCGAGVDLFDQNLLLEKVAGSLKIAIRGYCVNRHDYPTSGEGPFSLRGEIGSIIARNLDTRRAPLES